MKKKTCSWLALSLALISLGTTFAVGCSKGGEGDRRTEDTQGDVARVEKKLEKPESLEVLNYQKVSVESEKYATHKDGGLIYNMLSREAAEQGTLDKYESTGKRSAVLKADGMDITVSMPTEITAYDMVPIDYTISRTSKTGNPVTVEAVAYEEAGRFDGNSFDLTIPGKIAVEFEYLGYVRGTVDEKNKNMVQRKNNDAEAASYPNYTTDELNTSGTVQEGDLIWLKFRYTNTGNTVLDCEGQGNFNFFPVLFKKDSSGQWQKAGETFNQYVREMSYVYPGESREIWLNFVISGEDYGKTASNQGLLAGDYKLIFTTLYRSELEYNADVNLYHGRTANTAEYLFTVAKEARYTKPSEVKTTSEPANNSSAKTCWLHYFEEFMTSFEQHRKGLPEGETSGRIYLQCAPWTDQVVIRIVHSNPQKIISVKIPVTVETDSLHIVYDADNINVIINEEGYEEPVICIQSMPDLRANVQTSPYPEETIINDLLTMQECGCNVTSWQGFMWLFDSVTNQVTTTSQGSLGVKMNLSGDALKYALDACRQLGLKSLGLASYPFGNSVVAAAASWVTRENLSFKAGASWAEADYADPTVPHANAITALYERSRWGDLYWSDALGNNVYTVEDTRGLMRYEHQCRYGIGNDTKKLFRDWLKEKYGTVEELNKAWGTDYQAFIGIDPEANQPYDDTAFGKWVYFTNKETPFYEWSPALIDYDLFRTWLRVNNYEDMMAEVRKTDTGAAVQMRTEGSQFLAAGIDPATTDPQLRQVIYAQLKGAAVAEIVAPSDAVTAHCDYTRMAFSPSNVRYLTRQCTDNGIISMLLPQFHDMRDIALNDTYGPDYTGYYNLSDKVAKGAYVHQLTAVYPWWKATYEEGGVPGILYQDLQCNGFATETQVKEMKFFKAKIDEMLSDPAVKAQTKTDAKNVTEDVIGKCSFDADFVASMIEKVRKQREGKQ